MKANNAVKPLGGRLVMNKFKPGCRILATLLCAALMISGMSDYVFAEADDEGPGFSAFNEVSIDPGTYRRSDYGPGASSAAGDYVVRFKDVSLYAAASDESEVIGILEDGTEVNFLGGPYDEYLNVEVASSGQTGYVKAVYLKGASDIVRGISTYTYDDMLNDILALRDRYPDKVSVDTVGATFDGRSIYHVTMSSGSSEGKKKILIDAGIHAREYANCRLVLEQLENCLKFWDTGTWHGVPYSQLFSGIEFHILPMVNPDGVAISQFGENGIRRNETLTAVRESYQNDLENGRATEDYESYLRTWKANGRGVDINRNFPDGFREGSYQTAPSYASYPGEESVSEVESKALRDMVDRYSPYIIINYHSMGNVLYWDLYDSRYSEQNSLFMETIRQMTGYSVENTSTADGGFLDWVMSGDTACYSVTIETGSTACPMPDEEYAGIWANNAYLLPTIAEFAMDH